MSMRVRMARAICESSILCGGFPEPCDMCVEKIDAILDAMREPSEEMFNKIGLGKEFLLTDETGSRFLANIPNCKTIWQAMIDAIEMENNAPFMGLLNKAGK